MYGKYEKIFFENLYVDVYISGNAIEGESILVLLKSSSGVIHSMLIDSYVGNNKENPLLKVLIDNKIHELDILVWSHPHEDHTKGMMKVIELFDNRIKEIIVPPNLEGDEKKYRGAVKEVFNKINEINLKNIEDKKLTKITYTQSNHYIVDKEIIRMLGSDEDIEFSIYAVAPIANLVRNRTLKNSYKELNDFFNSILLLYRRFFDFSYR